MLINLFAYLTYVFLLRILLGRGFVIGSLIVGWLSATDFGLLGLLVVLDLLQDLEGIAALIAVVKTGVAISDT